MKLLLTSAGFVNKEVLDVFLKLLDKPTGQIHVVFIPTASRTEHELKYVEESRQELVDLGITNITTLNLDRKVSAAEINNPDVIYICGGNTFYLLKKIRQSGLDKILPGFGGLYVGVSAGSVVMGPNVEVSGPFDENDVGLSDTTGLKIVDFAVVPHCQNKDRAIIEDLKNRVSYEIMELTDNQAVLVGSGERKIIGLP